MNFQEAIDVACCETTLEKALAFIALWECERVIPVAHEFLNGNKKRGPIGQGWDTCFEILIREVMEQYPQTQMLKKLKGIK